MSLGSGQNCIQNGTAAAPPACSLPRNNQFLLATACGRNVRSAVLLSIVILPSDGMFDAGQCVNVKLPGNPSLPTTRSSVSVTRISGFDLKVL